MQEAMAPSNACTSAVVEFCAAIYPYTLQSVALKRQARQSWQWYLDLYFATQSCCQSIFVKTVTMVPCDTPMYTLISVYLWGGFVSSQCFFPDGTNTLALEDGYYPCNSTTGGQASSCCQLTTSTCTTGGYCNGNNGFAYRGACTDPNFPSPCANNCLNGE